MNLPGEIKTKLEQYALNFEKYSLAQGLFVRHLDNKEGMGETPIFLAGWNGHRLLVASSKEFTQFSPERKKHVNALIKPADVHFVYEEGWEKVKEKDLRLQMACGGFPYASGIYMEIFPPREGCGSLDTAELMSNLRTWGMWHSKGEGVIGLLIKDPDENRLIYHFLLESPQFWGSDIKKQLDLPEF